MINMKLLHSYLTFWRERFWKKNTVLSQLFKILVFLTKMHFSRAWCSTWIWTDSIEILRRHFFHEIEHFSPRSNIFWLKRGVWYGLIYIWNSDVCKINRTTLYIDYINIYLCTKKIECLLETANKYISSHMLWMSSKIFFI